MKQFCHYATILGLLLFLSLISLNIAWADSMIIGMLKNVNGMNITVTDSKGDTKDFQLNSGSLISNLITREKVTDTASLKVGSKVRVSNNRGRVFALEVLEVPK